MGKATKSKAKRSANPPNPKSRRKSGGEVLGGASGSSGPSPRVGSESLREAIARAAQERRLREEQERQEEDRRKIEATLARKAAVLERARKATKLLDGIENNTPGSKRTPTPSGSGTSPTSPSIDSGFPSRQITSFGRGGTPSSFQSSTTSAVLPPSTKIPPSTVSFQSSSGFTSSFFTYDPDPNPAMEPSPVPYYASGRAGLGMLPDPVSFRVLWGNPAISASGPIMHRLIIYSTSLPPTIDGFEFWFLDRDPIRVGNCHLDKTEFDSGRDRKEVIFSPGENVVKIAARAAGWIQGVNVTTSGGNESGWCGSGWVAEGFDLVPGGKARRDGNPGNAESEEVFWCCGIWGSSGVGKNGHRVVDSLGILYAKQRTPKASKD
ncbi:hypothetical protein M427DRAFT_43608 [Gonapodya prolifera JEL478]|uniref:Uncharacterized protein n=1 Tax=Gonapodya prolifera (strain JEL478) TaxID=1344416 RepID=A0A139AJA7_GONPJ|nr:hypothetical protein M427DRAFT_43608 [Gonapodya prolifera JEL478]|eukprot:KXS16543.1 hypothetical protein M427DRAFT_43608 [Gonapodya prolifera JEL478]